MLASYKGISEPLGGWPKFIYAYGVLRKVIIETQMRMACVI